MSLDRPSIDDLNRGTLDCHEFTVEELGGDVGHIVSLWLRLHGNDDVFVRRITVIRRENGVEVHREAFWKRGQGAMVLGDDGLLAENPLGVHFDDR